MRRIAASPARHRIVTTSAVAALATALAAGLAPPAAAALTARPAPLTSRPSIAAAVPAMITSGLAAPAAGWAKPAYPAGDFGGGVGASMLPAGENGLVNAAERCRL